jgi:hypothetical protein
LKFPPEFHWKEETTSLSDKSGAQQGTSPLQQRQEWRYSFVLQENQAFSAVFNDAFRSKSFDNSPPTHCRTSNKAAYWQFDRKFPIRNSIFSHNGGMTGTWNVNI